MSTYLFFPPADKAQDEIWHYSCGEWGEKQAEKYIKGMHDHLQLLSEKMKAWRPLPANLIIPPDLSLEAYIQQI